MKLLICKANVNNSSRQQQRSLNDAAPRPPHALTRTNKHTQTHLNNVVLVEGLEAVDGGLQRRHCLCQVSLGLLCHCLRVLLHDANFSLLCCHHNLDLFGLLLIRTDL